MAAVPISATAGSWTWVDFPDSSCDDGTPTGIGVNLSATSQNVLVFLQGGGACWSYLTCVVLNTSTHGPYGLTQFNGEFANNGSGYSGSIFDRGLAGTPFADWNFVYVPYCTGDVHAGAKVTSYTSGSSTTVVHHVGHLNVVAYLKRLLATFPAPPKVAITGSSAGGFGALINYDSFRQAWSGSTSFLIDDSGPFLRGDSISPSLRSAWFDSWGLAALADPLCGLACHDDLSLAFSAVITKYPNDRLSLLESQQDQVISSYFGLTGPQFETDLQDLLTNTLDPAANFRSFIISGNSHTMLGSVGQFHVGTATLPTFIGQQLSGDAAWANVHP